MHQCEQVSSRHKTNRHKWLKRGRARFVRRQVKIEIRAGNEPAKNSPYHGWED